MRELPPLVRVDDPRAYERYGWQRQVKLRAENQLRIKHAYGHHRETLSPSCPTCQLEVGILLRSWTEPHPEIPRGFR